MLKISFVGVLWVGVLGTDGVRSQRKITRAVFGLYGKPCLTISVATRKRLKPLRWTWQRACGAYLVFILEDVASMLLDRDLVISSAVP